MKRSDRFLEHDRPPDQRIEFQRDRDRILYSPEFRRLAEVTQVVHAGEGHAFHNRLTHSLKVAQVARRITERLIVDQSELAELADLQPDVAEAAALAHDIGHPPFGHIAEHELDRLVIDAGVPDGYEGNAQTFRIVTRLSIRHQKIRGLNLTRASLNAILKYPWGRTSSDPQKFNAYQSEKDEFDFARKLSHGTERSIEAEIMDWADDVAYSVHDVEDFYQIGMVPLDRLIRNDSPERERFISAEVERIVEKKQNPSLAPQLRAKAEGVLNWFSQTVPPALSEPFDGSIEQRAALHSLSAALIKRYVEEVRLVVESGERVRLSIEPTIKDEVETLKELMRHYVFCNPSLATQQHGQRKIIRDLFEMFEKATQKRSSRSILPRFWLELLSEIEDRERGDDQKLAQARIRLVADVVASLTEKQAWFTHQRLSGAAPGSVLDNLHR